MSSGMKIEKGFEWDGNGVPPIVEVEWLDCLGKSGWLSVKKACELEPAHCATAGYLLGWDDEALRLSGSRCMEDGLVDLLGNTDVIPAGWVKAVRPLHA